MKKMKKILAVLLSMAMVMGMGLTVFAADAPSATDEATITVNGVEADATVTAYKIVEAVYNSYGLVGYQAVDGVTITDPTNPTSDDIANISQGIEDKGLTSVTMNGNGTTYTASVTAGYWIVIVKNTESSKIYNPMLLGAYYSVGGSDKTMTGGTVGANDNWTLTGTEAWPKSDNTTLVKTIVNPGSNNPKGDDVAVGDTITYNVATQIPNYSSEYTTVQYTLKDTLSEGLSWPETKNLTIKVDGEEVDVKVIGERETYKEENPNITVSYVDQTMQIEFSSAYALENAGKKVTLQYDAVLNDQAATNFNPNNNYVELEYSNDPSNSSSTVTLDDKTYTYTFEIDGDLSGYMSGSSSTIDENSWNDVTEELMKGYKKTTTTSGGEITETTSAWEYFAPLEGAEFKLFVADADGNKTNKIAASATTDQYGRMNFEGLDAGNYVLVETKAPDGYTVNNEEIPVEISATYNPDGTLASYTIKIDNKETSTYTATYVTNGTTGESTGEINTVTSNVTPTTTTTVKYTDENGNEVIEDYMVNSDSYFFWNTTISNLPSTGGIGTTIFTIGGIVIMVAAAGLFFASRRKKTSE